MSSNIYSILYSALSGLGYTVREQGTFGSTETLPATFITYQLIEQPNDSHYDNRPISTTSRMQVTLYSQDPAIKQNADNLFKSVLLPAGFMRAGGRDLPFNSDTGHYAYTSDYRYYDMEV